MLDSVVEALRRDANRKFVFAEQVRILIIVVLGIYLMEKCMCADCLIVSILDYHIQCAKCDYKRSTIENL